MNGSFELLTAYRHLQRVEWILHDEIRINVVASAQDDIGVALSRFREEEELCASGCLKAAHEEAGGLQGFYASGCACGCYGGKVATDGVYTVKRSSQNEIVISRQ